MSYTNPQYLLTTDELETLIEAGDNRLKLFDITVHLVPNPPGYKAVSGLDDYNKTHIPEAAFMDLVKDLSDTKSAFGFTLPKIEHLQAAYRNAGISDDSKVVFYSSGHLMWATRAWWLLLSSGHKDVAVLDGGFRKWTSEDKPTSNIAQVYEAGSFNAKFDESKWADKDKVVNGISDTEVCTINALSPGVYSGDADMHYGRRGHIENSKNVYYEDVLIEGCFKSAAEIETVFTEKGILNKSKIITYCGGGISATIDTMALSLIGHEGVSVYDGSMSEWVKDESLPLTLGKESPD
jgi:thiosulfate/3-mercaptopyruvate sulfurtransferase